MEYLNKVKQITSLDGLDNFLSLPIMFTLIVITQGCFGGNGVVQTPAAVTNLFKSQYARFLFIFLIAYTATSDIETAVVSTAVFFIVLHLLRTDEEKKEVGSYF
jgi:hypothetical protein|tara:strand:- start:1463 stop:1774 length:312 start_codon:yes stop_codon:yes gene_type:complete